MDLDELVRAAQLENPIIIGTNATAPIVTAVVCDSRRVQPATLFCCIRGAQVDGHGFASQALADGAVALVVERELDLAIPQIVVGDSRSAAGHLASACAGFPSRAMRVIGVTGTNGKTTTTFMVEAIIRAAARKSGVIGTIATRYGGTTVASRHTTPDQCEVQLLLAAMLQAGVDDVAMEVSSHALDQQRVAGVEFAVAAFTNLTQDHLDYHGSMVAYGEAKAQLFSRRYTKTAVINVDDDFGQMLVARANEQGLNVLTYGMQGDVSATDVSGDVHTTTLRVAGPRVDQPFVVSMPYIGAFNIANALCAIVVALSLGYSNDHIRLGLAEAAQVPGRLERVSNRSDAFSVFIDYAHTPDAIAAVAKAVRSVVIDGGRVCLLYGCGGDRDPSKRAGMGRAAARHADVAVLTSDNPRSEDPDRIIDDVLAGLSSNDTKPEILVDRTAAIEWIIAQALPNDIVVIAGKGHEATQTIGDQTLPFDDAAVARAVLARTR